MRFSPKSAPDDLTASGRSSTSRLNDMTGRAVLFVLLLAPIPLGSNRPFFWALWAFVLGVVLFAYGFVLYRNALRLRLPFSIITGVSILFALVAIWMGVQVLPIGNVLPLPQIQSTTGYSFSFRSISLTPGDSLLALLRWLSYGVLFFLALQASVRKQRARRLTWFILLFVTAQAAYALVAMLYLADQVLLVEKTQYLGEATGTFINRNSLATYLGFGAVLALLFALPDSRPEETVSIPTKRRRGRKRTFDLGLSSDNVIAMIALLVLLSAIMATGSRMGLFATFCGLATASLLRLTTWKSRLLALAVLMTGGIAFLSVYGAGTLERMITVERDSDSRLTLYSDTLDMIADRPLLGFGAQSFEYAFTLYDTDPGNSAFTFDKAHSTYLTHWSELGIVFGSLPILIVVLIGFRLLHSRFGQGLRDTEICAALGVIVLAAVHSIVDFSLEIEAVTFLFVTILAIGVATAHESGQKQARKSSEREAAG
jgi:O-antigen ligase